MTLRDFLMFSAVAVMVAVAAHWCVRKYWLAVLASALVASLANISHEIITHDFAIRPADGLFWLPMLFAEGFVVALPTVALIGIPFYLVRREKH